MFTKEKKKNLNYAEKAFFTLNEILAQDNILKEINKINKGEHFVLYFLKKHKDAVFPSEISKALDVSTARISALLANLEKKGQIERKIDINNRRNILVIITETGREYIEDKTNKIQNKIAKIFMEMGEADTVEFIQLFERFSDIAQTQVENKQDNNR